MLKRRKVDPSNASVLELAYARTGSMLKASRVVAFVIAWGTTRQELGRRPSVEEFADYWGESRPTAYRQQALFRQVFDRCETPDPVLDLMEAQKAAAGARIDFGEVLA